MAASDDLKTRRRTKLSTPEGTGEGGERGRLGMLRGGYGADGTKE